MRLVAASYRVGIVCSLAAFAGCGAADSMGTRAIPATAAPSSGGAIELPSMPVSGAAARIGGKLDGGMIRGKACLWLDSPASGDRITVFWPAGYKVDPIAYSLQDADGNLVAERGQEIVAGGGFIDSAAVDNRCTVGGHSVVLAHPAISSG